MSDDRPRFTAAQPPLYGTAWRDDLRLYPQCTPFGARIGRAEPFGVHMWLGNPDEDEVWASFPWWDHLESGLPWKSRTNGPCGTIDEPFTDIEQSFETGLFAHESWVYVCQGYDWDQFLPTRGDGNPFLGSISHYFKIRQGEFESVMQKIWDLHADGSLRAMKNDETKWVTP